MESTCKKIKAESQNPTLMDMMAEMDRLTRELSEVKAENYMLKIDNELLHNRFDGNNEANDGSLLNEYENEEVEMDDDAYRKAYSEMSLPKELDWKY